MRGADAHHDQIVACSGRASPERVSAGEVEWPDGSLGDYAAYQGRLNETRRIARIRMEHTGSSARWYQMLGRRTAASIRILPDTPSLVEIDWR